MTDLSERPRNACQARCNTYEDKKPGASLFYLYRLIDIHYRRALKQEKSAAVTIGQYRSVDMAMPARVQQAVLISYTVTGETR
jgi:hypothetical protein